MLSLEKANINESNDCKWTYLRCLCERLLPFGFGDIRFVIGVSGGDE